MIPIAGLAIAGGILAFAALRHSNASKREDEDEDMSEDADAAYDLPELAESIGWPYWWNRGSPSTPWYQGANGVDCNGYSQMAMVRVGTLDESEPDRSASAMADWCVPVAIGEQRPGDLAYYPGHTMVVCSEPFEDGHSAVIGASGGGRTTQGDDPKARVKVFSSALYRGDFVTYMRPPYDEDDDG